jgi:hypothetical protein
MDEGYAPSGSVDEGCINLGLKVKSDGHGVRLCQSLFFLLPYPIILAPYPASSS